MPRKTRSPRQPRPRGRPRKAQAGPGASTANGNGVQAYRHPEATRKNIPPAGMASYDTAHPPPVRYAYDPHLDPQLVWAGKAGLKTYEWDPDKTSFQVDTVSLHIHERISTQAILKAVRRREVQRKLFEDPEMPLADKVEFYQHDMNWANRLILSSSATL